MAFSKLVHYSWQCAIFSFYGLAFFLMVAYARYEWRKEVEASCVFECCLRSKTTFPLIVSFNDMIRI